MKRHGSITGPAAFFTPSFFIDFFSLPNFIHMHKKNIFWSLGLAILCLLPGCILLAKWSSGIHDPKPLSPNFVLSQAKKKNWDTERVLFLSTRAWASYFEQGASFPQVIVFDHQGKLLFKRPPGAACAKGFPHYLRSLKEKETNEPSGPPHEPVVFQNIPELQFKDGTSFHWTQTHEYYVFSFWADFAGKMSKWVDTVEHLIQKPPATNALHFMVNCDPIDRKKR
jgi:hypothetical protein